MTQTYAKVARRLAITPHLLYLRYAKSDFGLIFAVAVYASNRAHRIPNFSLSSARASGQYWGPC